MSGIPYVSSVMSQGLKCSQRFAIEAKFSNAVRHHVQLAAFSHQSSSMRYRLRTMDSVHPFNETANVRDAQCIRQRTSVSRPACASLGNFCPSPIQRQTHRNSGLSGGAICLVSGSTISTRIQYSDHLIEPQLPHCCGDPANGWSRICEFDSLGPDKCNIENRVEQRSLPLVCKEQFSCPVLPKLTKLAANCISSESNGCCYTADGSSPFAIIIHYPT